MKKHTLKYFIILILTFVVIIAQSCDDSLTSSDIDKIVMPDSNVSYKAHVAPVFEVKCVPCHNSQRSEAGLNLSSWVNATRDPTIIFPGSDSTSILVYAIERIPPYAPMPPNEWLKRNHINGIRTWIREGAQNN
jgi:Planctomycete cytochrome C